MTATMQISFLVTDDTTITDLTDRLDLLAETQGIRLGTVEWSDPHERNDQPGQWVTATAPITRTPEPAKRGKKR